ncbi:hypothetical protein [Streptomyces sp. NPDC058297]|uniref:hypothetical protein n=1 Tax=Streptomyces sp. NPDC058297 TaxID=3346433 RepID=UPI0036E8E838
MRLKDTNRSAIVSNKFKNYFPGMIDTEGPNKENLISNNHFRRELSPGGNPPVERPGRPLRRHPPPR